MADDIAAKVTAPAPAKAPTAVINQPAPVNGELTPEERKARLDEIRRRMTMSTLHVEPPKGWEARWARHVDTQDIARLEYKGYQIVKDDPKTPRYKTAVRCREDGTYIVGDVILMEVPSEVFEFLKENEREKADLLVRGATEDFISRTLGEGVPTFERDARGREIRRHR